ncbi:MAG: nicotinamide riboside transporter PnuC [Sumerlaeia bacterium]
MSAAEWNFLIETAATIFGLLCVWLTIRQNIWCWPTGLAMVVLYVYIFWNAKLYSDMGLQVIYIGLQIYGWWFWLHGGRDRGRAPVRIIPAAWMAGWIGTGLVGMVLLGTVMSRTTDASLPYWDAATTVLSLIAQWLMGRKVLQSWLFWIAVDVLAIGIYLVKGLHQTSVLYAVFLVMATLGFFAWRRAMASGEAI